eukprot:TRINITY_DN45165_c0_g1_i1.p1 TRINITY_DN45165_c0_g1~~TRINITY_DN45165_c0_g1_i1.p1  ORF type:complete len:591 (+),score=62.29 TRINITY_DN45165_c0_g1_i1:68-1840(+)
MDFFDPSQIQTLHSKKLQNLQDTVHAITEHDVWDRMDEQLARESLSPSSANSPLDASSPSADWGAPYSNPLKSDTTEPPTHFHLKPPPRASRRSHNPLTEDSTLVTPISPRRQATQRSHTTGFTPTKLHQGSPHRSSTIAPTKGRTSPPVEIAQLYMDTYKHQDDEDSVSWITPTIAATRTAGQPKPKHYVATGVPVEKHTNHTSPTNQYSFLQFSPARSSSASPSSAYTPGTSDRSDFSGSPNNTITAVSGWQVVDTRRVKDGQPVTSPSSPTSVHSVLVWPNASSANSSSTDDDTDTVTASITDEDEDDSSDDSSDSSSTDSSDDSSTTPQPQMMAAPFMPTAMPPMPLPTTYPNQLPFGALPSPGMPTGAPMDMPGMKQPAPLPPPQGPQQQVPAAQVAVEQNKDKWLYVQRMLMTGRKFRKHCINNKGKFMNSKVLERFVFLSRDAKYLCWCPTRRVNYVNYATRNELDYTIPTYGGKKDNHSFICLNEIRKVVIGESPDIFVNHGRAWLDFWKRPYEPKCLISFVANKRILTLEATTAEEAEYYGSAWNFYLFNTLNTVVPKSTFVPVWQQKAVVAAPPQFPPTW